MSDAQAVIVPEVVPAPKKMDTSGRVIYKGGQTVNESFLDSVVSAYCNLVNAPIALFVQVFLLVLLIAETGKIGPLENAELAAKAIAGDKTEPVFIRQVMAFVAQVMRFLIAHKMKFIPIGLIFIPAIAKPSSKNIMASLMLSIMVLLNKFVNNELLLLSQLYFLFVMLRNPRHKFAIAAVMVAIFMLGITLNASDSPQTPGNTVDGGGKIVIEPEDPGARRWRASTTTPKPL